jgi:hypothetical protein
LPDQIQFPGFAALLENLLEFEGMIEMILHQVLAASGDQHELIDPRGFRFFDGVLDQGLVDDRQHFLGHALGCRQEPRAETGHGQDGFTDWFVQKDSPETCGTTGRFLMPCAVMGRK